MGNVVRRVAVSGSGLAESWTRCRGRTQPPLTATADSSPTAEIPQSPKHGLQCPASRSPRRNIATVTWEFPKWPDRNSVWTDSWVVMAGEGDANYNLWDICHKSVAVADQRQPRRNCAEVLPKRREHILNGRAGMSAGVL